MTETQVIDHDDVAQHPEPVRTRKQQVARVSQSSLMANPEPMNLIAMAVSKGAGIEVIEKLVGLQERIDKFNAKKAFNAAIADARGELPVIVKNRRVNFESKRTGGATDYAHEDFAQIATQIDPVLKKFGLSYRHRSRQNGNSLTIICVLSHRDGYEEDASELTTVNDTSGNKNVTQGVGSAATYLQRYTLKLALGLAAAEQDDDGIAAGANEPRQQAQQQVSGPPRASATAQQQAKPQQAQQQAPSLEIIPKKDDTFSSWSLKYIAAFKTANTVDELVAYDKANDSRLTRIYHEARATYDEINKAYQHHMRALEAKAAGPRPDPISSGPAPVSGPKWTSPDPDKEYEAFLVWATDQLVNWTNANDLEEFWNTMIEPFSIFPSDKDDLMGLYRKAEHRLGG